MSSLRFAWPAAAAYAALWWILSAEGGAALAAGAFAVAAALAAGHRLRTPAGAGLRWARLPRFAVVFAWHSMRAGLDVARRAFSPDMGLRPGWVVVPLALRDNGLRVALALVVSLLPGTIAARLDGARLTLHALDERHPVEAEVRRFEREIAALFGEG
jgi:multicomponent Na+:H+ antiporter subunit E